MVAHLYKQNCGWVWDDTPPSWFTDQATLKLLVEWDADCNNDGIVDYGQIRAGQLPDFNGNNIPDCCDQGVPCTVGNYPVQWRASEGGNGHWYDQRVWTGPATLLQINAWYVANLGAHVVTLSSAGEDAFVYQRVNLRPTGSMPAAYSILGGYQDASAPDYSEPAGGWRWITGEPMTYLNWGAGLPDNNATGESVLQYPGAAFWNDAETTVVPPSHQYRVIVEWDSDCNNDGIVDYGQIMSGQLADANSNSIPDTCEGVVTVPGNYPNIQAAIDSTPTGASRTIIVAAGIYPGPIDFKGKSVIVRGAGASNTTLLGSATSGSVVRMMSGEPATARLEGFRITGGNGGTPLPSAPSALCGGGLLAINSAASVVDCVFEGNAAPFGGGAYFLSCSGPITNCTFRQNNAQAYGGGLQLFGCTSTVQSCVVENNIATTAGAGMHLVLGNPSIRATTVRSNSSNDKGGGISWDAAGSNTATCLLDGTTVLDNTATYLGGGVYVYPRPTSNLPYITATLSNTSVCTNGPRNVFGPYLATGTTTVCDCAGDVNLDGVVNGGDIGAMLAYWGPSPSVPEADANHDGVVNGFDLGLLLANWGPCAP
jgi:hypothetical protein